MMTGVAPFSLKSSSGQATQLKKVGLHAVSLCRVVELLLWKEYNIISKGERYKVNDCFLPSLKVSIEKR